MGSHGQSANVRTKGPRGGRRVVVFLGLVVVLLVALFGRRALGRYARSAAARHLAACRIGAAEECLNRADWLDSGNGATDILRAACFRHLGQRNEWQIAMASARKKGAPGTQVARELMLGEVWWNVTDRPTRNNYAALIRAGAAPRESATAVVFGMVSEGDSAAVGKYVAEWASDTNDTSHESFLNGVRLRSIEEREAAIAAFEETLSREPGHEPARFALAQLLEESYQFEQALTQYATLLNDAPARKTIRLDLARVLRTLGRLDDARNVLDPVAGSDALAEGIAIEMAEIEYESGNYGDARRWFERTGLDGAHRAGTLRAAASVFALNGEVADAQQLFARVEGVQSLTRQVNEWQRRLVLDPDEAVAAHELEQLIATPQADDVSSTADSSVPEVSPLYLRHCAACHGSNGDGDGRAARHLFPRPSSLRTDRQRLVSTLNGVATHEDLKRVIRSGIPGTSMPAFEQLTDDEQNELAGQVQQFFRAGTRNRVLKTLDGEGEAPDDEELARLVADLTTPGPVLPIPHIDSPDARSIDHGRTLFSESGCRQCHGDRGTEAVGLLLLDDGGRPTPARDLVHDPMKGGVTPEALYRRIRLGMPGTPHPASPTLEPEELVALVHFCRSLPEEPQQQSTNYQRVLRAARAVPSALLQPAAPAGNANDPPTAPSDVVRTSSEPMTSGTSTAEAE